MDKKPISDIAMHKKQFWITPDIMTLQYISQSNCERRRTVFQRNIQEKQLK